MSASKTEYVILLHGLGRTKLSMHYLGVKLARAGYSVLNFGYRSRNFAIDQHAKLLQQFLRDRTPSNSTYSFVTHSLGSIVLRKFALQNHEFYKLRRAVFLGPPNQGSETARLVLRLPLVPKLFGPALFEVADLELPAATDLLEIGVIAGGKGRERGFSPLLLGDNDGIVSVEETLLPGLKDSVIVPALHSFLMFKSVVIQQTLHFLEHGYFNKDLEHDNSQILK